MQSLLELRHLKTLAAIHDTGSVTRAAERLHLTQSALSHQLRLLEEHYGVPLLTRKGSTLAFTPAGEKLVALATSVLPQVASAERDVARLREGEAGQLRIAVECHTCFDWLMPAMDTFRERWPEVELDIVSGFHADPVGLMLEGRADLAVVSELEIDARVSHQPLFVSEMVALVARDHALAAKPYLDASDFASETLITYPVPDDMLDLIRKVLRPAGVNPPRRTTELTVAMLQLVASKRGIAALPRWSVQNYLDRGYIAARPVTAAGLTTELYAAIPAERAELAYLREFVSIVRDVSLTALPGISLLD
ncbi:LysR family transcriptional regulator [Silvimonas sp. JCM 19000]